MCEPKRLQKEEFIDISVIKHDWVGKKLKLIALHSHLLLQKHNWALKLCPFDIFDKKLTLTLLVSVPCMTSPWNRELLKNKAIYSHSELDQEMDFSKHG